MYQSGSRGSSSAAADEPAVLPHMTVAAFDRPPPPHITYAPQRPPIRPVPVIWPKTFFGPAPENLIDKVTGELSLL